MPIIITGVSGFIGRAVARHFANQSYRVYGIDRNAKEDAPLADLIAYEQLDLQDPRLARLITSWKPQALIHCAGRASVPAALEDPAPDFSDGPALSFALLNTLRRNQPDCTFVFLSSAAVYGDPLSLPVSETAALRPLSTYGYHKWQSEILCTEFASVYGMHTVSARLFSAYGIGLRRQVVWDIVHKALTNREIRLQGSGQESRDFLEVQDIACGLEIILLRAPARGEVYNLASGTETRIVDLADLILQKLGSDARLSFSGELPPGTPKHWRADVQKLSELGFQAQIALDQGVAAFVDWCKHEIGSKR